MNAVRTEIRPLLAFDGAFPQRDEMLDAYAMDAHLARILGIDAGGCEIVRAKYRPAESLRFLYRLADGTLVTARVFPAPRRADEPGATCDERLNAAFRVFPRDRKIAGLGEFAAGTGFRRELVAYAPEKCATFRCSKNDSPPFAYAKIFADEREAATASEIMSGLAESGVDDLFPRAFFHVAFERALYVEAVAGERVADRADAGSYAEFGRAVARLHDLPLFDALPPFRRHGPDAVGAALDAIRRMLPAHAGSAERLAARLAADASEAGPDVPLHGDVHAKNAILGPRGLRLIDFDQASRGPAAADIGSFLAGLRARQVTGEIDKAERDLLSRAFLDGYRSARPLPPPGEIARHGATALLTERCARAIGRCRVASLENFAALLGAADEILDGASL